MSLSSNHRNFSQPRQMTTGHVAVVLRMDGLKAQFLSRLHLFSLLQDLQKVLSRLKDAVQQLVT